MKTVLVSIASDPRASGRAAEGLRVADGLALTEELRVSVRLSDAAAAILEREAEAREWVDGEIAARHLRALRERGVPIEIGTEATAADAVIEF